MNPDLQFGTIIHTKTYVKDLKEIHFMRKFEGFGMSTRELAKLRERNVNFVLIKYIDGHAYLSALKQWEESEVSRVDTNKHQRADPQVFLKMSEMLKI